MPVIWGSTRPVAGTVFGSGTRPWADVRAYGATGDGQTDDTVAIQAAIDVIKANPGGLAGASGTVFFSPGVYCVSSLDCTGTSGLELIGCGSWGSSLYGDKQTGSGKPIIDCTGVANTLIRGINVHAQQSSGADPAILPTVGILLAEFGGISNCTKVRLQDVGSLGKFSVAALYMYGATDCIIDNGWWQQDQPDVPAIIIDATNAAGVTSPHRTINTGTRPTGDLTFIQNEIHPERATGTSVALRMRGVYTVRFYGGNNDSSGAHHVELLGTNRNAVFDGVLFYSESGSTATGSFFYNNGGIVNGLHVRGCDFQNGVPTILGAAASSTYRGVELLGRPTAAGWAGNLVSMATPGVITDSWINCDGQAVNVGAGGTIGDDVVLNNPGTITAAAATELSTKIGGGRPAETLAIGSSSGGIAAGTTNYFGPLGSNASTEDGAAWVVPHAIRVKGLRVYVPGSPGAGQSFTFTLRKNSNNTAITCVVSEAGQSASDLTNVVDFDAGDLLTLRGVGSAGAATTGSTQATISFYYR